MKYPKNANQAEYNARRKFKTRSLSLSDEDHAKIVSLAGALDVSQAKAVIIAVDEKLAALQ